MDSTFDESNLDKGARLLLLDDDLGFLRLISRILERDGHKVKCISRGKDLIKELEQDKPDLLLMDLNLPDLGGIELAHQFKSMNDPLPFIVMTGNGDEKVAVNMMKQGALDYVVKDANFIELIPIVVSQSIEHITQNRVLQETERRLFDTAQRLEKAQSIAGMGSFEVCRKSGTCYHFSTSMRSLFKSDTEVSNLTWQTIFKSCINSLDYKRVATQFQEFLEKGHDLDLEFRARIEKSQMHFVQLSGHIKASSSDRALVICRNISERKKLQSEILKISGEERQRIGQDIHDGLCQHLAGLEAMMSILESKPPLQNDPSSLELVQNVRALTKQATQMSRDLAHGLVAYEVDSDSWHEALSNLAETINRQNGLSVSLRVDDSVGISDYEVCNAVFRIAQEAITNVRKHAEASSIYISIVPDSHFIDLIIEDDGKGMELKKNSSVTGLGIHLMKYRAESVGGYLDVSSRKPSGFRVHARLPNI